MIWAVYVLGLNVFILQLDSFLCCQFTRFLDLWSQIKTNCELLRWMWRYFTYRWRYSNVMHFIHQISDNLRSDLHKYSFYSQRMFINTAADPVQWRAPEQSHHESNSCWVFTDKPHLNFYEDSCERWASMEPRALTEWKVTDSRVWPTTRATDGGVNTHTHTHIQISDYKFIWNLLCWTILTNIWKVINNMNHSQRWKKDIF